MASHRPSQTRQPKEKGLTFSSRCLQRLTYVGSISPLCLLDERTLTVVDVTNAEVPMFEEFIIFKYVHYSDI